VHGLKIEGRMKSPEYVYNVTRLYREILDTGRDLAGYRGLELPQPEYEKLVRNAELGFSREKTTGWLLAPHGERLIEQGFPGHKGARLGIVDRVQGRDIVIRIAGDLSLRDGLGLFPPAVPEPVLFPAMRITREGREVRFARAGDTVSVELPSTSALPAPGAEVRHLSSRFLDLPQPKEAGFPLYKIPVDLHATLGADGALSVSTPGAADFVRTVTVEKASRPRPFAGILASLLEESGDSLLRPGAVTFSNSTSELADNEIFVPPSQLKKVKNELYAHLDAELTRKLAAAPGVEHPAAGPVLLGQRDLELVSRRQDLGPATMAPVPFVSSDPLRLTVTELSSLAGFRWVPLPPVDMEDVPWAGLLRSMAESAPSQRFAVGLSNLSHLTVAGELADAPNLFFFVDFYLYAANTATLALLRDRVPKLLFVYSWIEAARTLGAVPDLAAAGVPVVKIDEGFRPPLFYSLGCFARHILNGGQCVDECPKDFSRRLSQGRNGFEVAVRDCVTYLFRA
jgi:putative protease